MATITSAQSGLASAASTWVGGVVPIDGDKVIIAAGHTVTLDGTYTWGNDAPHSNTAGSGAIDVYGTLRASRTVSSELIVRGWIQIQPSTGGRLDFGTSTDRIPLGVTATLTLNRTATAFRTGLDMPSLSGQPTHSWYVSFCGSGTRTRNAVLAQAVVAGATQIRLTTSNCGWQPGDLIRLPTSMDSVPGDRSSTATVASVSGDLVTLTAGLANGHKAGCRACNLTSNVLVRPWSTVSTQTSRMSFRQHIGGVPGTRKLIIDDAELRELGNSTNQTALSFEGQAPVGDVPEVRRAVYNHATQPMVYNSPAGLVSEDNVFLQIPWGFGTGRVQETGSTFFRQTSGFGYGSFARGSWLTNIGGTGSSANAGVYEDCIFSGQQQFVSLPGTTPLVFRRCDIGWTHGWRTQFGQDYFIRYGSGVGGLGSIVVEDCLLRGETATFETADELVNQGDIDLRYINKQRDPTQQERHTQVASMVRDNVVRLSGASTIKVTPHNFSVNLGRVFTHSQSIICASGATVKLIVYVRVDSAFYNAGDWTPPTVKVTGLGQSISVSATAACVNAWERFEIDATNVSGFDGSFTLSYDVAMKTLSGGNVWFDGTPDGLFITKVRHYGYFFDEGSATRRVNIYTQVAQAVAAAYTGATINAATKRITFGAGTIDTFAKLYDYSQAWGVQNIDLQMPWDRAGALLALNSGWTVVDPAISGMTWGGGVVEWNSAGVIDGSYDGCTFDFRAVGTYDLAGANLSGTITLVNNSGGNITVKVVSGVSYVNTTPATITVEEAVMQAAASVTNVVPGSRIQVVNVTAGTEVENTIVAGTSWSLSYPDGSTFSAGDIVQVRLAYQSGAAAKVPAQYRTVASEFGWSILADQVDDKVYNANAIDGDAVTEFIEDYPNVEIDIDDPDGVTTVQRGYAWYIAGQMTENGIRFFHGGMTAEDDVNYRINVDLVDMRIQNVNAAPVRVVGGRLYRSDGSTVIRAGGGGVQMEYGRAYAVETGVSGLTAAESDRLMQTALETTAQAAASNAALAAALSA
jgi:hypothetical protein